MEGKFCYGRTNAFCDPAQGRGERRHDERQLRRSDRRRKEMRPQRMLLFWHANAMRRPVLEARRRARCVTVTARTVHLCS